MKENDRNILGGKTTQVMISIRDNFDADNKYQLYDGFGDEDVQDLFRIAPDFSKTLLTFCQANGLFFAEFQRGKVNWLRKVRFRGFLPQTSAKGK